jgi:hypothetical protein
LKVPPLLLLLLLLPLLTRSVNRFCPHGFVLGLLLLPSLIPLMRGSGVEGHWHSKMKTGTKKIGDLEMDNGKEGDN